MNTTATWVLDPSHSELLFRVRHLMISSVKGQFRKFNAFIDGDDFSQAKVHAVIEAGSVFTNDEKRDQHLMAADFFDVENHKEIRFDSTRFHSVSEGKYQLEGHLTMLGKAVPVTLDVDFGGKNKDPWGNEKAAFAIKGKINRKDWGLNWNAALETGGVLVSEDVEITGEFQFARNKA